MTQFTERGESEESVRARITSIYGPRARITSVRSFQERRFGGLVRKRVFECTGYVPQPEPTADHSSQILGEIRSLSRSLKEMRSSKSWKEGIPPSLKELEQQLEGEGFSDGYRSFIISSLRRDMALEDFENRYTLSRSVEKIFTSSLLVEKDVRPQAKRVEVLVGPTGVGKTTTIAKLAARCVQDGLKKEGIAPKVALISIDSFKIGAQKQLASYARIMQMPFFFCTDEKELGEALQGLTADVVFIDTTGRPARDFESLGAMHQLLGPIVGRADISLVISAATKTEDLEQIMLQYQIFKYQKVIGTKFDETQSIGSFLSALWKAEKTMSFMSTGQNVPLDLKKATFPALFSLMPFLSAQENDDKEEQSRQLTALLAAGREGE